MTVLSLQVWYCVTPSVAGVVPCDTGVLSLQVWYHVIPCVAIVGTALCNNPVCCHGGCGTVTLILHVFITGVVPCDTLYVVTVSVVP